MGSWGIEINNPEARQAGRQAVNNSNTWGVRGIEIINPENRRAGRNCRNTRVEYIHEMNYHLTCP